MTTDDTTIRQNIDRWFDDDTDLELWEALDWTREQLIDWVIAGGDPGADDFWEYIAGTIRHEDQLLGGLDDQSRADPGRGPGRLGHWYHVRMFGACAPPWLGRYIGFTTAGLPKVDHLLHFVTREGERRTIRYGALAAAKRVTGRRHGNQPGKQDDHLVEIQDEV